jgi:hypothetical protein
MIEGGRLQLVFFKLPHHGSHHSFPNNILNFLQFADDSIAVATRHPRNNVLGNRGALFPLEQDVTELLNEDEGGIRGEDGIHAFDVHINTWQPFVPVLYSYSYDTEQNHLIGRRFYYRDDFPEDFIQNNTENIQGDYFLITTGPNTGDGERDDFRNELVKVMMVWLENRMRNLQLS